MGGFYPSRHGETPDPGEPTRPNPPQPPGVPLCARCPPQGATGGEPPVPRRSPPSAASGRSRVARAPPAGRRARSPRGGGRGGGHSRAARGGVKILRLAGAGGGFLGLSFAGVKLRFTAQIPIVTTALTPGRERGPVPAARQHGGAGSGGAPHPLPPPSPLCRPPAWWPREPEPTRCSGDPPGQGKGLQCSVPMHF